MITNSVRHGNECTRSRTDSAVAVTSTISSPPPPPTRRILPFNLTPLLIDPATALNPPTWIWVPGKPLPAPSPISPSFPDPLVSLPPTNHLASSAHHSGDTEDGNFQVAGSLISFLGLCGSWWCGSGVRGCDVTECGLCWVVGESGGAREGIPQAKRGEEGYLDHYECIKRYRYDDFGFLSGEWCL